MTSTLASASGTDDQGEGSQRSHDGAAHIWHGRDNSGHGAAQDAAAKDSAAKDSAAKDSAAKDSAAKDSAAKDWDAQDTLVYDWAGLDWDAQDTAGQSTAGQDLAGQQDTANQDWAGQDGTVQDSAGHDWAGQNGTDQDWDGQERADREQADEHNAGLNKIAKGSTLNLVGAGISAAATLGVTVLVTRQFSPPVAGAFFAAISLYMIIETLSSLGAYNGVIYFIARLRSPRQISAMIRMAIIPVLIVSVAAGGAMFAFADPLARLLLGGHLVHGAGPASVGRALRVLALTVPFGCLADTFLGASRGFHNMRPTVVVDRIGRSGAQLVGVAIAALTGATALLAPLWTLPYIPAGVIAWLWFRRISRRQQRTRLGSKPARLVTLRDRVLAREPGVGRPEGATFGGFWRFTAPRAMAMTAQVVIQRLDIVLVGIMKGPVDAAIYTAATRFLVVGQLGNTAISMAAQPQLAHLFATGEQRSANAVYQATTAWLIILTWPLYLLAVIYGPAVLAIFGHSYTAGADVMVILGLTMLLTTACGQVDVVLTTAGRSSWSLANWLVAVAINVGVDLALIPKHGIEGAAIGWAVALGVTNLLMLVEVGSIVRVSPFGRGCLTACVLATVSFGAIPFGVRTLVGGGPAVSSLAVLAGCAVFAVGLWRFRQTLQLTAMPGLSALAGPMQRFGAARSAASRQAQEQGQGQVQGPGAADTPVTSDIDQGRHRRRSI